MLAHNYKSTCLYAKPEAEPRGILSIKPNIELLSVMFIRLLNSYFYSYTCLRPKEFKPSSTDKMSFIST